MKSPLASIPAVKLFASGANGFSKRDSPAWRNAIARAAPGLFPPEVVVQIKALACELPAIHQVPLSRWSTRDLAAQACQSGIVATISGTTIWRWLNQDAIRPWQHRCWIFPRDPNFAEKAGRILDLYERVWEGHALQEDEFVLSTDEKTSIQARKRRHQTLPTKPGSPMKVEHEYTRCGAWAYIAALDVHRFKLFGSCTRKNGIEPFDRLVAEVMSQSPYNQARRVFWVMDNGTAHRAPYCVARLKAKHPTLVPVHGPVHASWLNQIEIYFSIVQRKVLTPMDVTDQQMLTTRLLNFQDYYQETAKPFSWKFTAADLKKRLEALHNFMAI